MQYTEENFKNAKPNDLFEFECQYCHQLFTKTKREIKRNKTIPKYCSQECAHKGYNKGFIEVECKYCHAKKVISKSDYEKKIKRSGNDNFFCDQSCAAKYNNSHRDKKGKQVVEIVKSPRKDISNYELGKYIGYGDKRLKYISSKCQEIRKHAKRVLMKSDEEKVCFYCHNHEFDEILEVHHIKPISKFDECNKISEINNINNLVWLCPNHHTMLEKGLITIDFDHKNK